MKLSMANITIFVLFLRFVFLFRKHESNIKLLVKSKRSIEYFAVPAFETFD